MKYSIVATAVFCVVFASAGAAGPRSGIEPPTLHVTMTLASPAPDGSTAQFDVAVTNSGKEPMRVTRWELPSGYLDADLFDVRRDGKPVAYTSRIVERGPIPGDEYIVLDPGKTVHDLVDLALAYDMSRSGVYTLAFRSPLHHSRRPDGEKIRQPNGLPFVLQSASLDAWIGTAGSIGKGAAGKASPLAVPAPWSNPSRVESFTNCTANDQSGITALLPTVISRANDASYPYGSGHGHSSANYLMWFGLNTGLASTVYGNYLKIYNAFFSETESFYCRPSGCGNNVYGYVYPSDSARSIFLCNYYFATTQTEKIRTLIHEMSHFTTVAGTQDLAYGTVASLALAVTNPANAIRNADNYAYYAE